MLQMRCSHSYTLNKNVFSLRLNMSSPTSDVQSSAGRLFYERGPWADYSLPQLRSKFRECALLHAGPAAWNSLPEHIRAEPYIHVCRKLLKTHPFNLAFNVH